MQRRILISALAASLLAATAAQGQDKWPSKPISYIVPFLSLIHI